LTLTDVVGRKMLRVAILASVASALINTVSFRGAGDPECKLGHRSFSSDPAALQVCCPKYCGKCDDWAGCGSVNEQDSQYACCAAKVTEKTCENNAEDPYCLQSCDKKSAPCSLGVGKEFVAPEETTASEDCGNAVGDFKAECEASVKSVAPGSEHSGESQWKGVAERAAAASNADNAKQAKLYDAQAHG